MSGKSKSRPSLRRRNFLRGAAGVSLALPFLEGLPERSAWGQTDVPTFSLFVCGVDGCVPEQFFPSDYGALTPEGLANAGRATSELARHADRLLLLSGLRWGGNAAGDAHIEGLIRVLTARTPVGSSENAEASGPSADTFIASMVHPELSPINLHVGNAGSYGGHRLSWQEDGTRSPVIYSPFELFQQLVGLAEVPEEQVEDLLLTSRKGVHDFIRDDLSELLANPRLSAADRVRLERHLESIRDVEGTLGEVAATACSSAGFDLAGLQALEGFKSDYKRTEEIVLLNLRLVALAFACNHRRTATLQWGDPYDGTVYDVPSNERGWRFSHIDHRIQSDGSVGNDALAAQAHAEIDVVRMQTLAAALDEFSVRELADQSLVMWTLNYATGASHSFNDVPHILWGNGGGRLKQAQSLLLEGRPTNNRLLNSLISVAVQDTGKIVEDFGEGSEAGLLEEILV